MRPSAPWMKNARKSSVDIRSTRRQISRQCCGGWLRGRISQTERQQPATASPRCAEGGRTRRGSAGLSPSNERRKAMIDVVSVRVADVCREVVGAPFGPKARFLVGSSSRVHRRLVAGSDSVRAFGGECDVKVFGDFAILQPETRNVIDGETALGRLTDLVRHVDAKRLKHLLVKFARPFQVSDGEINMVNHGFPLFVSL